MASEIDNRWLNLPDSAEIHRRIASRVLGQPEAVEVAIKTIRQIQVGLSSPNKPLDTLLLMGPTGVGKTELAITLASEFFNENLARFDMSDYAEPDSARAFAQRLTTEITFNKGLILFDEIEKAHENVIKLFLQILDTARLRNFETGEIISYENHLVIGTSNVGSRELAHTTHSTYETLQKFVMGKAADHFSPEVMGRWRKKVVYRPLEEAVQRLICKNKINSELNFVKARIGLSVVPSDTLIDHFNESGIDKAYGARPLNALIESEIRDAIAVYLCDEVHGENSNSTLWIGYSSENKRVMLANSLESFTIGKSAVNVRTLLSSSKS